jgi:hypothetical protein
MYERHLAGDHLDRADLDALATLLMEEVFISMPPICSNTRAGASSGPLLPASSEQAVGSTLVRMRADDLPAFGAYYARDGRSHGSALSSKIQVPPISVSVYEFEIENG